MKLQWRGGGTERENISFSRREMINAIMINIMADTSHGLVLHTVPQKRHQNTVTDSQVAMKDSFSYLEGVTDLRTSESGKLSTLLSKSIFLKEYAEDAMERSQVHKDLLR